MAIKIVEVDAGSFQIHGNLNRTPYNQLRRKLGKINTVAVTDPEQGKSGTVRQLKTGKHFDWWINEWGDVAIVEAK